MSDRITVSSTIGEAFNFAFGNISAVFRIGWFPVSLMMALLALIGWIFFQPIIMVYGELLTNIDAMSDADALTQILAQYNENMLAAVESIGYQTVSLGYLLFLVVGLAGSAIPMTAYSRMIVNGDRYRGLIYFQFGGREVSVAITYFAVTVLVTIIYIAAVLVAGIVVGIVGAIAAAALGDAGTAVLGLLIIGTVIVAMIFMLWLFARLLIAIPASAIEGGAPIGKAWTMTKGHGATLTLALLLGYILLIFVWIVFFVALDYVVDAISMVLGDPGSQLGMYVTMALGAVAYVAMVCVGNAFFIGLFAGPYKRLTAGDPSPQ